ncbi:MAG TPA: BlaI/MecI/CopY family transcriptional regulator [Terriglobales bacterium]|nr:BlaI/MecI/CopY family transcriptional regulator [Terriglobales bacterium]
MGKRKSSAQLTPLELQIMKVLWETGPANVQTVQSRIPGSSKLAYTTVQTMLNVLHRKGRVKRVLRGRAYEYEPVLTQERAETHAVRDMIDRLFGGSVESLLMTLVRTRQLDPRKFKKLSSLVDQHELRNKEKHHGDD